MLKNQKWKPKRFKPIKVSRQTEYWYYRQLNAEVKALRAQVEGALRQPQSPFLMDSAQGLDAFSAEQFLAFLKKLSEKDRGLSAEQLAAAFVARGNQQNAREVGENLKRQTGIDFQQYLKNSPKIVEKANVMTAANVQLIKSIHSQYLDKVQTAVTQGVVSGKTNAEIAKQIREIGGVTENRAKFIARDQASKLNAAFTQARHEEAGITKYRWSTSGDERVRDSHAENDGKIFSYAEPPETGHPGQDFNCRCVQIPIVSAEQEKQAVAQYEIGKMREITSSDGYQIHLADLAKNTAALDMMKVFGISSNEAVSIRTYTTPFFATINTALRTGKINARNAAFAAVLNRALSKLPKHKGMVFRELDDFPEDVLAGYIKGAIITEKAFTSSSLLNSMSKSYRFVIHSKAGRRIEEFSALKNEREVLFKSGTKFKILSRQDKNGIILIELEEQ